MLNNQMILARMCAAHAIEVARRGPQASPHQQLLEAVNDAIDDARQRRDQLAATGHAGSAEYMQISAKIARWTSAWRSNR